MTLATTLGYTPFGLLSKGQAVAGKIFINYRRDDSIGTAGRLHDRLAQAFGRKNLFMDVDHIPAGVDFVSYLNSQVAVCSVFLAVIGPRWLDAKDESGNRRIDNPDDFVSIEIAAALTRDVRVIPVLIDGAHLPKAAELPDPLKSLVRRNAVEVRNTQFGRDAEALVKKVGEAFKGARTKPTRWRFRGVASVAALLLVSWAGLYQMGAPVWVPRTTTFEATKKADEEAERRATEEAARKAAEELKRKMVDEEGRRSQEDAARKALEEAARKAQEEATRKAQEDAARKAKEETKRREDVTAVRDPASAIIPGSAQSLRDRLADGQPCPTCPELVVVPGGKFTMGSPSAELKRESGETLISISIPRPFAVAKFALTFDEWDSCVEDRGCNGYRPSDEGWGRGQRPVINVSWHDAKAYVEWLSNKTGKPYRLLSETEREYITRATKSTPFWWGESINTSQANYDGRSSYTAGESKGLFRRQTVSVGAFMPNSWGFFNVHGNVWEWTEDCWNETHKGNPQDGSPRTWGYCDHRVLRGGSWVSDPGSLRSASRAGFLPGSRDNNAGVRVGREIIR